VLEMEMVAIMAGNDALEAELVLSRRAGTEDTERRAGQRRERGWSAAGWAAATTPSGGLSRGSGEGAAGPCTTGHCQELRAGLGAHRIQTAPPTATGAGAVLPVVAPLAVVARAPVPVVPPAVVARALVQAGRHFGLFFLVHPWCGRVPENPDRLLPHLGSFLGGLLPQMAIRRGGHVVLLDKRQVAGPGAHQAVRSVSEEDSGSPLPDAMGSSLEILTKESHLEPHKLESEVCELMDKPDPFGEQMFECSIDAMSSSTDALLGG